MGNQSFLILFIESLDESTRNSFYVQTLNYLFGGVGEDGTTYSGSDLKELLYETLTKQLGLKLGNIYESGGALNLLSVTYRVEGGNVILGILGYSIEINILENIFVISGLLYENMFSWMNALWEAAKIALNSDSIPDNREDVEKSVEKIKQQLDWQKRKNASYKLEFVRYKTPQNNEYKTLI